MPWISSLLELLLHLDQHLTQAVAQYGLTVYAVIAAVIYSETAFVVTAFLPGDSLVFAAATLASSGHIQWYLLYPIMILAALAGDSTNYWIGRFLGPKLFHFHNRIFNPEHLKQVHEFYERRGGMMVFFARYVPFMRAIGPFVAGVAAMDYPKFLFYNSSGILLWATLIFWLGYFFGKLHVVKDHFSLVIPVMLAVSLLPGLILFLRQQWKQSQIRPK
jgi:membrane-associated protein